MKMNVDVQNRDEVMTKERTNSKFEVGYSPVEYWQTCTVNKEEDFP